MQICARSQVRDGIGSAAVLRALPIVLTACMVAPAPSPTPPAYPAAPPPAAEPAAAPAPHHMTRAEIDAIPTVFPVTIQEPRSPKFRPLYEALHDNDPIEIGDLPSKLLVLEALKMRVPITVEECGGRERAYYHPRTTSIHVCYEFIAYINELRGLSGKARMTLDAATRNVLMFTTLHEIAHALIDRLHLEVGASEEDAADQYAYLSLTTVRDVDLARTVISAPVHFFTRHGEEVGSDTDGVHSAGADRSFEGSCILYGLTGESRAMRAVGSRAAWCNQHAADVRARWNEWLRPYSRVTSGRTFPG